MSRSVVDATSIRLAPRLPARRAGLPRIAGWLTAVVGAINVISALSPELPGRLAMLGRRAPDGLVLAEHALLLPTGIALLVLAHFLARRRQRALWLAVAILGGVGALELLKGLDVEEGFLSWALAGLLVWGRAAFGVRHDERSLAAALRRSAVAAAVAVVAATVAVLAAAHWATPSPSVGSVLREALALLALGSGPLHFSDAFAWVPLAVGLLFAGALVTSAWELFRPLRVVRRPRPAAVRTLVRQYGDDTLSAFKLRDDVETLVSGDGRAFLSYRVERGVLLVSGDPVGARDALPELLREACAYAAAHDLRIGAVAASEAFVSLARAAAGLHALYLGDEAIVATAGFSLEGRPIKKVRQAVCRLLRAGFECELRHVGELGAAELAELEAVSVRWRRGAAERGFSMAMDGLQLADSVVIVARDGHGRARGFLHFVSAYGRPAMSLSAMRRDYDTPNGLTDFLVVRAIQLLRERGIEELSLNFAAFARWLHSPAGRCERVLAAAIRRADPYFQIESLYFFNAKFAPRWQPRYLLHEGLAALPLTALAALWVEGLLPRPGVPALFRRDARRSGPALVAG